MKTAMNALGMANILAHWEVERQQALANAFTATRQGQPALGGLRRSSKCEARINKLVRLIERASKPRRSAAA